MKKHRRAFSWIVEEYAFGAAALRDEIKRHKRDDEIQWSLFKAAAIRLLYVYCLIGTCILVGIGIISMKIQRFSECHGSKKKE